MARTLLTALVALLVTGIATAQNVYQGFTIDTSSVADLRELAAIESATREQIDMVQAVGLPDEVLSFLQKVEFKLVPAGTFKNQSPGRYTGRGSRRVEVSAGIIRVGHKPVLLHELMHAYHDQRMPNGFKNRAILDLYAKARSIPAFAAKSHMMENANEYFACSATAYLFGVTAQEPFNREKIREMQPDCHAFLNSLFGANAGKYQGTLTRQRGRD